jgi:hypothetical protein
MEELKSPETSNPAGVKGLQRPEIRNTGRDGLDNGLSAR